MTPAAAIPAGAMSPAVAIPAAAMSPAEATPTGVMTPAAATPAGAMTPAVVTRAAVTGFRSDDREPIPATLHHPARRRTLRGTGTHLAPAAVPARSATTRRTTAGVRPHRRGRIGVRS